MVLSVVVAAAVLGRPVAAQEASAAMRYFPSSGARVVLENSDGTDTVAEYYSTFGARIVQSAPYAFGHGVEGYDEVASTTWARIVEVTAEADGRVSRRRSRMLAVKPGGFDVRVDAGARDFRAFEPGLPVLPAGVRDGQEWTAAGTATLGSGRTATGRQPYAATFKATAQDGGCMAISTELTIGRASPTREVNAWCPGRGIIVTAAGQLTSRLVTRAPRWQSAARLTTTAPPVLTGHWNFVRRELSVAPIALYATVRPVVLPGSVVVYVNTPGGDLVAHGWSDGATDPRWSVHPGGQVTSALAVGKVIVAATTERTVVAYGAEGEFLWQSRIPDVSAVPLVRFGNLTVVAGLDGTVTAFDAQTGRVAWTVRVPTEIRQPMVVDDTLTVVDQAGNLMSVDPTGTVQYEFEVDPPEVFGVADGVAVVASRGDSYVRGYRLSDGAQLWRVQLSGNRRSVTGFGSTVVIGRQDDVLGLGAADGSQRWARPITPIRVLARGDRLVVADRTTLRLLDASGAEVAAYRTEEQDLSFGSGVFLAADSGDLFCFFGSTAYRWESGA